LMCPVHRRCSAWQPWPASSTSSNCCRLVFTLGRFMWPPWVMWWCSPRRRSRRRRAEPPSRAVMSGQANLGRFGHGPSCSRLGRWWAVWERVRPWAEVAKLLFCFFSLKCYFYVFSCIIFN
jgi:hypothetical protein